MDGDDVYYLDITDDERRLLTSGLLEWGQHARGHQLVAPLFAARSVDEFHRMVNRLYEAIELDEALSDLEWTRALALTELSWGCATVGAGPHFWRHMGDERSLDTMRRYQRNFCNWQRTDSLINNGVIPDTDRAARDDVTTDTETEKISIDLTAYERDFLKYGAYAYHGPAHRSWFVNGLIGAHSDDDMYHAGKRLFDSIHGNEPLSELDWIRALTMAEIAWGSDLLGAGVEFTMTCLREEHALPAARSLQRKLVTDHRMQLLIDNALYTVPHLNGFEHE